MSKVGAIYLACQQLHQAGEYYQNIINEVSFDYNCSVQFVAQTLNQIIEEERNNVASS